MSAELALIQAEVTELRMLADAMLIQAQLFRRKVAALEEVLRGLDTAPTTGSPVRAGRGSPRPTSGE